VHHFFFPTEFLPSYILKGSTICVFLLKFTHFYMEYIWKFHTLRLYSDPNLALSIEPFHANKTYIVTVLYMHCVDTYSNR